MLEAVCKLMKIVAKLNSNTFHFRLPIRFYLLTFQDPVKFLVTSQRHQLVFIAIRRFIFDVLSSVTERLLPYAGRWMGAAGLPSGGSSSY